MCWKVIRKEEKEYIESIEKKIGNKVVNKTIRDTVTYLNCIQ